MLKDFQGQTKILLIATIVAIVFVVGGIFLLREPAASIPEQTTFEKVEERNTEETVSSTPQLTVFTEFLEREEWWDNFYYYSFYIEGVTTPGLDPDGRTPFRVNHILVVVNPETDDRKEFELRDLVDEQVFSNLKEKGAPPSLCFKIDEGSLALDGKTTWGRIDLIWCGDDFENSVAGNYFKIDAETWDIETIEAPAYAANAAIHPKREAVLYDKLQEGLLLYWRELRTDEETVIVSYPSEVVSKYVNRDLAPHGGYPYFGSEFTEKLESRALLPEWIDENTVSYLDFETREKVVVDLNALE